jgi:hypothetical protein
LQDCQAGDSVEVADIVRSDRVVEFQRAGSDDEIAERKIDALGGFLTADPSDDLRRGRGNWMDWNSGLQFVEEGASAVADVGRGGTIDAVADLGDGDRAQHDRDFTDCLQYAFDGLSWCEFPALGGDQDTGVED